MYACICNALTEREVRNAAGNQKTGCVKTLFQSLQCAPQCGTCIERIGQIAAESDTESDGSRLIAAE